jgi:hypothetical protein
MILDALNSNPIPRGDLLLASSARWRLPPYFFIKMMSFFAALSMSNVNEKSGVVGRSHGVDTMVLMMAIRFNGHGDWVGDGVASGLGASWWGGMVVVVAGSFPGGRRFVDCDIGCWTLGEGVRRSLSGLWIKVSARTHLGSPVHYRNLLGWASGGALSRGYSSLIGGCAGS